MTQLVKVPSSTETVAPVEEQSYLVHGSLMAGYMRACVNLNIVAGRQATQFRAGVDVNKWYPLSQWRELERLVEQAYDNVDPIMVKVGIEMMTLWYHDGPGKSFIQRGASFLHFQTGSSGFSSVVRGPEESVGAFELEFFDRQAGRAIIHTTTPFNRKMECGVLIGGILAPGDVDYVDVNNDKLTDYLVVEFH